MLTHIICYIYVTLYVIAVPDVVIKDVTFAITVTAPTGLGSAFSLLHDDRTSEPTENLVMFWRTLKRFVEVIDLFQS